jgi:hypothetical protein
MGPDLMDIVSFCINLERTALTCSGKEPEW